MDIQLDQFKKTFFQECDELLASLEHQLLALKGGAADLEPLHAAFRAIHSIKGGAGIFGFGRLVDFAHTFESALRLIREGSVEITDVFVDAAIHAGDVVADLVTAARTGVELPADFEAESCARLAAVVGIETARSEPEVKIAEPSGQHATTNVSDSEIASRDQGGQPGDFRFSYRIAFCPHKKMLHRLNEPLLIMRHLKGLGTLTVAADISGLPALSELSPTDSYLTWTLTLETDAPLPKIKEAFEFVEGDCDLNVECTKDRGPRAPIENADQAKPKSVGAVNPQPAASITSAVAASRSQGVSSIRVDLDRIDRLVDMVGEIAVSQTMVYQHIDQSLTISNPRLFNELSQLLKLTQLLQDSVMAIRAQPIRSIFARMPRVVRDLVSQTGKNVRLETSGEDTEIDKTVIEQLSDPLTHMIRNAVDHGIEPSDERVANGKPAEGVIRLAASQRGSQIVIEVSDDGRGIDRDKVRRKAIEENLLPADAKLSDDEINNLIFLPGLSTADKVSNISGRGVGMDVVKRNIQKLGGRVSINSEPGRGSKMTLTLPLTLAVIDGMIVRCAGEIYVIPIANILECLAVSSRQLNVVPGSGEVINVRGAHVRVVRLSTVFDIANSAPSPQQLVILIEIGAVSPMGLVVDEIIGQQQVVMKSFRESFGDVAGVAGATIMGDGAVALILDAVAISELSATRASRRLRLPTHHANTRKHVA